MECAKMNIVPEEVKEGRWGVTIPLTESTMKLKNVKFEIQESYLDLKSAEPTFTLRILLENDLSDLQELERKVIAIALDKKKEVSEFVKKYDSEKSRMEVRNPQEVVASAGKYDKESFKLVREVESDFELWGTLYHKPVALKITTTFWRVVDKNGRKKKRLIENPNSLLPLKMEGDVVVNLKQIFLGKKKSITCVVDEVLVRKETKPVSAFDDLSDDESD